MTLTGDSNLPAMPMKESEVNHLRQLLAWMRVEYTLDEDMQRGYLQGAHDAIVYGLGSEERVSEIIQKKADQINHVPAYVRQAHKMLTKALRKHEIASGVLAAAEGKAAAACNDCGATHTPVQNVLCEK